MSICKITLAAAVSIAASVAVYGQPGVGYVFQLPGQNTSNGQIYGYPYAANPLSANTSAGGVTAQGPNGTYQIVAKPDGTGYYVLGSTLQIANNGFTTFTSVNGIAAAPTALAASPDGNYAVVGAGDVYVLSASTYQILLDTTTGGTVVGVAISQDSRNAYVLSSAPYGSVVTQISLGTSPKNTATLQLTGEGNPTSIAFSPLGLLYVGATNRVIEINPSTFTVTPNGTMTPNATPGPLRFTPDGTTLYFANTSANVTGGSIVQIILATYAINSWPPETGGSPTSINDVLIAGNSRIFAISQSTTTLFDVSTSPLSLSVSSLNNVINNQAQNVLAAAVSSELPAALYLYLIVGSSSGQGTLYRITLATNQVSTQVNAAASGGILEFVGVPPQSGAASFIQYNANQTVAQSATSLPLEAQVLDLTGRPIFNLPVSFTTPAGNGIVINTPTPTTNANGFVQTTIMAPAAQGMYTITLTAGTANTSYTITVPGTGGSSGTGPGGVSQVTVVSGNGELLAAGFSTSSNGCNGLLNTGDPLTVLVTDVNGVPLSGVLVNFSVTTGTGNLATAYDCAYPNASVIAPGANSFYTDPAGLAYINFVGQQPGSQNDFEDDTVVASTPYGSASFTEVEYATTQNINTPIFPPQITLLTPTVDTSRTVTVAVGGVAQNAVTASIFANSVPELNCPTSTSTACPIPGVGIRIIDPNNIPAQSPYAYCQASSTLSTANTGVAACNVAATCGAAPGSYSVVYGVGDLSDFSGTVIITKGSAQTLTIQSGNNQTGPAGGSLPTPLIATVTDACGNPVAGAQVIWAVTQGSATLSKVVSTSGTGGQVSAYVTFGSAAGTVQVTASFGTSSVVTFSLTSQAVAGSMTILNGNNQTATVGTTFPQSLTVQLKDGSGNPISGVSVSFAITSGNATANPTSATTDSQGRASTIVTASTNPGSITVVATYSSVNATFTLTAVPQGPVVSASNFQNAASFQNGLVPCGLATATGSGLAPGITGTVSGASFISAPPPLTLDGLSLSVNGTPAPIYQLSNTNGKQQVTFQTPCEATPGSNGTVVITLNGATTTVPGVTILQAQPGIFYSVGANGTAYGAVIDSNGNYVTATNPAKRGGNYYLVATGLGQVTPATATDSLGINGQNVNFSVIVGVSNLGVPVFEQVYEPGAVGIYIIGFTIPLTNPAGVDQPLALAVVVNGQTIFGNVVYLNSVQ
jgi:uncharacterized protein (TIGR03437 family)